MEETLTPAQRYAAAKARSAMAASSLGRFAATLSFELDSFQVRACQGLERGHGVLVAAPTGAGKTVVGEFACQLALEQGLRLYYTTPIKALSNQKHRDLADIFGADQVGLLTGDQSLNPRAPIVVMTTEVLRNMLYGSRSELDTLGFVVMDEVHYLSDRARGGVWEEVIIHLDQRVQLVSLSATVSNAEEFGDWLNMVRGTTDVVVSEHRPVPLHQQVMIAGSTGAQLVDLYGRSPANIATLNPQLQAMNVTASRRGRGRRARPQSAQKTPRRGPSRSAVVDALAKAEMLPAIYFVFSRQGCQSAVAQAMRAGYRLVSEEESAQIRQVIERRTSGVAARDLQAVGYWAWRAALEQGIAAHHAGLLTVFRQTVEELFAAGLVKVVFATETLALGINMPARSVVLEKLVKWDGNTHAAITAGEYTQLTGRAGRRGIDTEGHGIVVDHHGLDPGQLLALASRRTYPLKSSFVPTPNMAVNLVDRLGPTRAKEVLEMSFAQFQADRGVVDLATEVHAGAQALRGYDQAMQCDRGSIAEYLTLRDALREHERTTRSSARIEHRTKPRAEMPTVRRGDILAIPTHLRHAVAVHIVQDPNPRITVVTTTGKQRVLTAQGLGPLNVVGTLNIPASFNSRLPAHRTNLAQTLRATIATMDQEAPGASGEPNDETIASLRTKLRAHPCHQCPERDDHLRWATRHRDLEAKQHRLTARIQARTSSISRDFTAIVAILTHLGYIDDTGTHVTHNGRLLGHLYAEDDLLIAECLRAGAWNTSDPAILAALVSAVVYHARRQETGARAIPDALAQALAPTINTWSRLDDVHIAFERGPLAPLDLQLVTPMYHWAQGASLDSVLREADLGAGDFVRWCKQVLDVLGQLVTAAPDARTARTASAAIERVAQGVVALV